MMRGQTIRKDQTDQGSLNLKHPNASNSNYKPNNLSNKPISEKTNNSHSNSTKPLQALTWNCNKVIKNKNPNQM